MKFPPMINAMLPFENQEVNASLREQAPLIREVGEGGGAGGGGARGTERKRKSALARLSVTLYLH